MVVSWNTRHFDKWVFVLGEENWKCQLPAKNRIELSEIASRSVVFRWKQLSSRKMWIRGSQISGDCTRQIVRWWRWLRIRCATTLCSYNRSLIFAEWELEVWSWSTSSTREWDFSHFWMSTGWDQILELGSLIQLKKMEVACMHLHFLTRVFTRTQININSQVKVVTMGGEYWAQRFSGRKPRPT